MSLVSTGSQQKGRVASTPPSLRTLLNRYGSDSSSSSESFNSPSFGRAIPGNTPSPGYTPDRGYTPLRETPSGNTSSPDYSPTPEGRRSYLGPNWSTPPDNAGAWRTGATNWAMYSGGVRSDSSSDDLPSQVDLEPVADSSHTSTPDSVRLQNLFQRDLHPDSSVYSPASEAGGTPSATQDGTITREVKREVEGMFGSPFNPQAGRPRETTPSPAATQQARAEPQPFKVYEDPSTPATQQARAEPQPFKVYEDPSTPATQQA